MAKRGRKPLKKTPKSKKPVEKSLGDKLRMPELWIGLFVIGIMLGVLGGSIWKQSGYKITISKAVVSPIPTQTATNQECQPKETGEPIDSPTPTVVEAAQPSGPLNVTVLQNESYWNIAQRVCGDAKSNFLYISELNGNVGLYPGMTVKVVCQ